MVGYSNIINKKSSTTIPKDSFVAPSPSRNHSMLHQTFYPPLFRFPKSPNPFSATASLLPPPPPPSSLPEVERNPSSMEAGAAAAALQETGLPAAPPALEELEPELVFPDDVAWAVEHATMLDEFLVDDLLVDFDEAEVEEIKQENTFEADTPTPTAAATAAPTAEIFEPAPLSDMELWSHNPEEFEWMSSIIDESMVEYPPSAAVPTFIPTTQKWLPAVKRAKRSEGLRIPCSSWPCPFNKSDSSGSSTTTVSTSSSSSSKYSAHNLFKYGNYQLDQHLSKKRGRKPKNHQLPLPAYLPAAAGRAGGSSYGERSCTHCGSQKTPQWRLGPMGPKTLCNACGVRYKSGRLVPEYRPAASPTFIPQVHSSSHRKVMEMRRQKEMEEEAAAPPRAASC